MDLESYDNLAFNDIEFWSNDNTLKASKPAFDEVFDIIPEYTGVDLRSEINRLKRELPKPNTLAELLTEESPTADPTDMPSLFTNDKAVKKELSNLQKVPSLNDIYKNTAMTEMLPAAAELPLFTPGTNRKMSLALKTEFGLFEYERKRLNIPKNPSAWSHFHVKQWLAWIGTEFNITNVDSSKFKKTGRELFEMGEDAFLAIAPPFTGDILWEHLNFLVRESSNVESDVLVDQAVLAQDLVDANRNIDSSPEDGQISQSYQLLNDVFFNSSQAYTPQLDPPPPYTESSYTYNAVTTTASSDHKQFRHRLSQSMSGGCVIENEMHDQTVPSVKQELSSWDALSCSWGSRASPTTESQKVDMSPTNDNAPSSGNLPDIPGYAANGPIQLWQFLLQLLMDKNCQHIICWTGDGWEFKVLDTEELAKRWGARKNKPRMTYEKLSRGIRYYYDKKLIRKTSGKRYTYLYVCDLGGMLSHTPESLFQACGVSPRYDDEVYH